MLIVDDDPSLVDALRDLLLEEGYAVEAFTDPPAALERLVAGAPPDLMLLDYVMPGMNGRELLDALASKGVEVPTVLFTAMSASDLEREQGVACVIRKPFDLERLLDAIRRLPGARAGGADS